jgi:hypothetical protein
MNQKTKAQDTVTLQLETLLDMVDELELEADSGHTVYATRSMLKLYLYMLVKRIKGFKTLANQLHHRSELWERFGLAKVPHRTTLSRRFKQLPLVLRKQIRGLHAEFVAEGVTVVDAMSVDSSLLHAKGNVWHKKQRDKGELPKCGNIDQEAHWGKSGCGTWVYGYRVHCLVSGGPEAALPCDVEVTPANLKDAHVFKDQLAPLIPEQTQVLFGDGGFDSQNCYAFCDQRGISLVAPIKAKANTRQDRLRRVALYNDPEVRQAFTLRKTTVEPFQGRLKTLFELEYLYMKGLANVRALVILATLAYLLLALLNLRLERDLLKLQGTLIAIR